MPRYIEFQGTTHEFPDETPNEVIAQALRKYTSQPTYKETMAAVPGETYRQFGEFGAGVAQAVGDLTGSEVLKEDASLARKAIEEERKAELPRNMTLGQEAVLGAGTSILTNAPIAAGTLLAGPAAVGAKGLVEGSKFLMGLGTSAMGAMTGFEKYGETREVGFSPVRAGMHGVFHGLVEKYTEYIPIKEFATGGPLAQKFWNYAIREIPGEQVATLLQDLNDYASTKPNMTLGDFLHNQAVTALSTAIAGPIQGGALTAASKLYGGFIKPDQLTAEQTRTLATGLGAEQATKNEIPTTDGITQAAAEKALQVQMAKPEIDVMDLALPDNTTTKPEGMTRYYMAVPAGTTEAGLPQWGVWTPSLDTLQEKVNTLGKNVDIVYVDKPAIDVERMQAGEDHQRAATELGGVELGKEYILSKGNFNAGQYMYKAPIGEITTGSVGGVATPLSPPTNSNIASVGPHDNVVTVIAPPEGVTLKKAPMVIAPKTETQPMAKAKAEWATLADENLYYMSLPNLDTVMPIAQQNETRKWLAKVFNITEQEVTPFAKWWGEQLRQRVVVRGTSEDTLKVATPLVSEWKDAQPNAYTEHLRSVADGVKIGEVGIAPEVERTQYVLTMQKYLQTWLTMFAPWSKIVISSVAQEGQGAGFQSGHGAGWIRLPFATANRMQKVVSTAHEFGHHLQSAWFDLPENQGVREIMRQEWLQLRERIRTENWTVKDFIQRWMSPYKMLKDTKLAEAYGVKLDDPAVALFAKIDAQHREGYTISFEEFLAEQFTRYALKRGVVTGEQVGLAQVEKGKLTKWLETVKNFFDKIVAKLEVNGKYEEFLDSLRAMPAPSSLLVQQRNELAAGIVMTEMVDDEFDWTLKTLERLPKKQRINKLTIVQALQRQDVREQERQVFNQVLEQFEGDFVDRELLTQAVLQKVVPLETEDTSQYAGYGLHRIGVNNFYTTDSARTTLYQLPFEVSEANHFHDKRYFGHTRWFVPKYGVVAITEIQSDLVQKTQTNTSQEKLQKRLVDLEEAVTRSYNLANEMQQRLDSFVAEPNGHDPVFRSEPNGTKERFIRHNTMVNSYAMNLAKQNAITPDKQRKIWEIRGDVVFVPGYDNLIAEIKNPEIISGVQNMMEADIAQMLEYAMDTQLDVNRVREQLEANVEAKMKALPKHWWEPMLRAETVRSAKSGQEKMWLVTADTAAKVEGWPSGGFELDTAYGEEGSAGVVLFQWYDLDRNPIGTKYKTREEALKHRPVDYGRVQGIYDRYKDEITKFVKREWGAKEIVDEKGNTWLEWDVKPQMGDMGPMYYDLADNVDGAVEATEQVAEKTGLAAEIPELTPAYRRFQGFFHNFLQLKQTAKMLPNVRPMQMYTQLMEAMANLKTTLMSEPNKRMIEWYHLSSRDARGVMDMMKAETAEGKHWTNLTRQGEPTIWSHEITQKVVDEAKARGLSEQAAKLFVDVKNDYLSRLQTLEDVMQKSIERELGKDEIAMRVRSVLLRQQFEQFRNAPYYHDVRQGQHVVVVRTKGDKIDGDGKLVKTGTVVYRSQHKNRLGQAVEFRALAKQYGGEYTVSKDYIPDVQYSLRGLPKEFIQSLPEALGLTQEQQEKFDLLYYDITKEGAYLKMLGRGKQSVPGAEQDLRIGYADYMWRSANLISKVAYGNQLSRQISAMNKAADQVSRVGGDAMPLRKLYEYMQRNYTYVMQPQHEYEQFRALVAVWYLFGVPKTALMNATTLATTTYPRLAALAQERGMKPGQADAITVKEMTRAIRDVAQYWKDPTKIPGDGQEINEVTSLALKQGSLDQSFAAELAAVAEGPTGFEKLLPKLAFTKELGVRDSVRKATWQVLRAGMAPFRVVEEFNRRVTLVAAYRMAKRQGLQGVATSTAEGSAYKSAIDSIAYTQNEYANWNRIPALMGKQSVAFIFFSFVQNMSFFMFGGDKGWWRGLLVLAALGGLQGLPGAENLIDFLNWLGRKVFEEDVDLRLEAREMAQTIGLNPDYVMHGAFHTMFGLGWDASASVGLGRIIPGTDAIFGQGDFARRWLQLSGDAFGPAGNLLIAMMQAVTDDNPNGLLRWDRALPPAIRNLERTYNAAATGEWQDRQGRALVDDTTMVELLGQSLGFNPTAKSMVQERLALQRETAEYYVLRRQNLMSRLFAAKLAQDPEGYADAKRDVQRYNESVPSRQLRITGDEIRQSMLQRMKQQKEVEQGVSPSKRYASVYKGVADAFSETR